MKESHSLRSEFAYAINAEHQLWSAGKVQPISQVGQKIMQISVDATLGNARDNLARCDLDAVQSAIRARRQTIARAFVKK